MKYLVKNFFSVKLAGKCLETYIFVLSAVHEGSQLLDFWKAAVLKMEQSVLNWHFCFLVIISHSDSN